MSFITEYLAYTERQVSPRVFHLWSAMAILGAAMERRCHFPILEGKQYLYPGQVMVVLVSKSAVTKKTTAASLAVDLLSHLEPWQMLVLPKKSSPQQLLYDLQRLDDDKTPMRDPQNRRVNSAGFLFSPELGAYFTTEAFAETLATQINQLNDCPRGKWKIAFRSWVAELFNPCITILGCITPTGIAKELPRAARSAGFFGRMLLVHRAYTERRVSLMDPAPTASRATKKVLQQELSEIARMRGAFVATPAGLKWFNEWYYEVCEPAQRVAGSEMEGEQTGYIGRKDSHVIRVGMILSAAERRDRVLDRPHLEQALKHLEDIEQEFPFALAELGTTPYAEYDRRLLEVLERFSKYVKWVPEQRLRRALLRGGGDRRFTEATETLVEAGEVERRRIEGTWEWRRLYTSGRLLRGAEEQNGVRPNGRGE